MQAQCLSGGGENVWKMSIKHIQKCVSVCEKGFPLDGEKYFLDKFKQFVFGWLKKHVQF